MNTVKENYSKSQIIIQNEVEADCKNVLPYHDMWMQYCILLFIWIDDG